MAYDAKERARFKARKYYLKRYGLTPITYQQMVDQQDGKCAICGRTSEENCKGDPLHVDHDHKTGKVRGLLCGHCNRALGLLGDSPEMIRRAAEYLERSRSDE